MPLGKKYGGRKKGSVNKRPKELLEKIEASGMTPLEYLLSVMRAPVPIELQGITDPEDVSDDIVRALSSWHAQRVDAAKAAAPYIHPKLNAVHTTTDTSKSFEEWLTEIDENQDDG
jgi:hypothetical protein